MKKTINVNLNGRVFTIDEDAYHLLDNYLDNLRIYFGKEDGAAEIIADFESRIEELFSEKIRRGYQVINLSHVEEVIARVGKPDDFSEKNGAAEEKETVHPADKSAKKKFFRNPEDKIIGGVCSGISAHFGWDILLIRIVFIILIFATSLWMIPAYLLVWIFFPEAKTAEQKLQMRGEAITVENIGKMVASEIEKAGREEKYGCIGGFFKICFIVLGFFLAIFALFAIAMLIAVLFVVLFGAGERMAGIVPWSLHNEVAFLTVSNPILASAMFIILLLIPFVVLIYGIVSYFAKLKPLHASIKWISLFIWVLALIFFLSSGFEINMKQFGSMNFYRWRGLTIIEGNGVYAEKEYIIPPIDDISVDDNLVVHLQIEQLAGDSAAILLSGDENVIDKVRYKINNGQLRLSMHENYRFHPDENLIIRVQTPSLKKIETGMIGNVSFNKTFVGDKLEIESEGAGKFWADSLTVQYLTVNLDGAASVNLAGYARNTTFNLDGAGKIDSWDLLSDTVYARIDGIGSIRCNPAKYLKGKVSGIGKIRYKNEPDRRITNVFGIGSIGLEE
jgi:phage shock protein PspC (stress-responsive transcriptional regulator)